MIEKAPINLIEDKEYTAEMLASMEGQRDADHQYYLKQLKEMVNQLNDIDKDAQDTREFTQRTCRLLVEWQALLKEVGEKVRREIPPFAH